MQVRWEQDAILDLVEIRDYIYQDNPTAANSIANKIISTVELLVDHPLLGKAGRIHKTRELVVSGTPYLLVYLPASDNVSILRVFHQSRNYVD